jgi:hypothetical protein
MVCVSEEGGTNLGLSTKSKLRPNVLPGQILSMNTEKNRHALSSKCFLHATDHTSVKVLRRGLV